MKAITGFVLALVVSVPAFADFGQCNFMFPKNTPPSLSLRVKTRELCFDSFAVLYSVDSKTPVYTIEKLNYLRLSNKSFRTNHFHEEPKLGTTERSTLSDYARSGYDRGHMAPAADMPNSLANEESFSLSNMVPQAPKNNRGIWAKSVEKATRQFAKRATGNVYVFTGPYYSPNHKTIGPSRVWVPDFLFKLVLDEASGRSWVFWVENSDSARMSKPLTYEEFVSRTGLHLLNK
jgi:endonuclease G